MRPHDRAELHCPFTAHSLPIFFESSNALKAMAMQLHKAETHCLPGSGTCSAMFTANTMASAVEVRHSVHEYSLGT